MILKKSKDFGQASQFVKVDKYTFIRNTIFIFVLFLILLFSIYFNYEDDGGDHFIVIGQGFVSLITLFFILTESRFFENSWLADRYETLTSNTVEMQKVEQALLENEYYLSNEISLKSLSEKLKVGSNTLSKVINSESEMNFNDYINQKRIEKAKTRLLDNTYSHLTIEAVGNSVGFNSKSAFYSAFKKHTNTSPSTFVKENKAR